MRIRDWRIAFVLLLLCGAAIASWGAQGPILPHDDPANQREFQNVYQAIQSKSSVSSGTGAPSFTPKQVGDIYIATNTSKVYVATATVTSASWCVVN